MKLALVARAFDVALTWELCLPIFRLANIVFLDGPRLWRVSLSDAPVRYVANPRCVQWLIIRVKKSPK